MSSCPACGHPLGVGRFCTSCGAAVDSSAPDGTPVSTPVTAGDWRTDTAERTAARPPATSDPRTPPTAVAPPPPPRYPLFADEVEEWSPHGPITAARPRPATPAGGEALPASPVEPTAEPAWWGGDADAPGDDHADDSGADDYDYDDYDEDDDERRTAVPWIAAALVVLMLAVAGWWYLARDDGSDPDRASDSAGPADASEGDPAPEGVDVAGRASAEAPRTAPPNQDVDGRQVSYDASNMLDGVPETAWRAAGDGTGLALRFKLAEPTELHRVGIINGYAKTSTDDRNRTFDWYLGNRRVEAVVWVFDDGTKVRQQLQEDRALQMIDVEPVTTRRVVLRLVRVSAPGTSTAARNFTAVSEVSLVGVPESG